MFLTWDPETLGARLGFSAVLRLVATTRNILSLQQRGSDYNYSSGGQYRGSLCQHGRVGTQGEFEAAEARIHWRSHVWIVAISMADVTPLDSPHFVVIDHWLGKDSTSIEMF